MRAVAAAQNIVYCFQGLLQLRLKFRRGTAQNARTQSGKADQIVSGHHTDGIIFADLVRKALLERPLRLGGKVRVAGGVQQVTALPGSSSRACFENMVILRSRSRK